MIYDTMVVTLTNKKTKQKLVYEIDIGYRLGRRGYWYVVRSSQKRKRIATGSGVTLEKVVVNAVRAAKAKLHWRKPK